MAIIDLDDLYRIDYRSDRGDFNELRLRENVVSALKNRLSTPIGRMPFNALYGTRLKEYVGEAVTPELLNSIANEVEQQARKDYRVKDVEFIEVESKENDVIVCNVSLTLINTEDSLSFRLVI